MIKPLLFYSKPLSPFISKNSSLHLPSKSAAGLSSFFLSTFLKHEGENRHLAELVQPLLGALLLRSVPLLLLHLCCLSCVNLMLKNSRPLSPQSKSSLCIFEEVSVAWREILRCLGFVYTLCGIKWGPAVLAKFRTLQLFGHVMKMLLCSISWKCVGQLSSWCSMPTSKICFEM